MKLKMLFENLVSVKMLSGLRKEIIKNVQAVYDLWSQDEEDGDPDLGFGGICDLVAEKIVHVLDQNGIESATVNSNGMGENHTWVVAKFAEGCFLIDIPPDVYETGSGYHWIKKKDVAFHPEMISVEKITSDPEEFELLVGDF